MTRRYDIEARACPASMGVQHRVVRFTDGKVDKVGPWAAKKTLAWRYYKAKRRAEDSGDVFLGQSNQTLQQIRCTEREVVLGSDATGQPPAKTT